MSIKKILCHIAAKRCGEVVPSTSASFALSFPTVTVWKDPDYWRSPSDEISIDLVAELQVTNSFNLFSVFSGVN